MTRFTLTLQQPAQIGTRRSTDFIIRSEQYVPGWQIRGAFAAAWLRRHGTPVPAVGELRDQFVRLFEGAVRYGPAFDGAGPVSLALHRHKYRPRAGCQTVVDRAATDAADNACRTCGQEWVPMRGWAGPAKPVDRRSGVEIGADGVAIAGRLFARESIRRGTILTADIIGADDLLTTLDDLGPVQLGGRRCSYGLARTHREPDPGRMLGGEVRQDGLVIVRLASPAVFVDATGHPSATPAAEEVAAWFGASPRRAVLGPVG